MVVDEQRRLLGTLTDGDIRRGLLHGETRGPGQRLMNRKFRSVRSSADQALVLEMMRRDVLRRSLADQQGRVIELLLLQKRKPSADYQRRCDHGRWKRYSLAASYRILP